jgi:hypothetical protein
VPPANSQYAPSAISTAAGISVPMITAGLFSEGSSFSPKKLSSVSPQKTASMTITR